MGDRHSHATRYPSPRTRAGPSARRQSVRNIGTSLEVSGYAHAPWSNQASDASEYGFGVRYFPALFVSY